MKKNLLKITFASLLALSLGACSCSGNGGNSGSGGTSTSSTTSVPPHVHQYDEHGVCSCGAYRGETKNATQEDPYVLANIVAGTEYYFRLGASKGIQTVFTCNIDPKVDIDKTKLWETNGTVWSEIPINSKTHILSNVSDGYYYFRYVSTQDLAEVRWFVQNHVHQAIDPQGFCWCDEYMGSTLRANQEVTINPTVANEYYYARVKNLNPAEKYELYYEMTAMDLDADFFAWGTNDGSTFVNVNVLTPTAAIGYKDVYLKFKPSISGYSATFKLVPTHLPDNTGYCAADGEFIGEELNAQSVVPLCSLDEGTHFFRVEVAEDDLVMFTLGGLNINGEVKFYSRSVDGETITELNHSPEVAFIAPELPDGYLYIKIVANTDQLPSYLGLVDMNSGYGYAGTTYVGRYMKPGQNTIAPLGVDEALFYKFDVHEDHLYQIANWGGYDNEEVTWFGHNVDEDSYFEIGHPTQITVDSNCEVAGVECDNVVVRIMPADGTSPHAHGGTAIQFSIGHTGHLDQEWVCELDNIFTGTEVEFDIPVNYDVDDDTEVYRFPIVEDGETEYSFSYSNGAQLTHFKFYRATGEHTYEQFGWSGAATSTLTSTDGYIYIHIASSHETYSGTFTVSRIIN